MLSHFVLDELIRGVERTFARGAIGMLRLSMLVQFFLRKEVRLVRAYSADEVRRRVTDVLLLGRLR